MYGLLWILLAVKIACWTAGGASAGAAALPSGSSCATVPGTVMSAGPGAGAGVAGATGVGVGVGKAAPPEPFCASAVPGRTSTEVVAIARANARREIKPYSSFVGLRG